MSLAKEIALISATKKSNLCIGITPTVSGFSDQIPADIANFTDGNIDNPAGEGIKELSAGGTVGSISIDLGADITLPVEIYAVVGVKSTSPTIINCYVQQSPTGSGYVGNSTAMTVNSPGATTVVPAFVKVTVNKRYFVLMFQSSAASTVTITPYQLYVHP